MDDQTNLPIQEQDDVPAPANMPGSTINPGQTQVEAPQTVQPQIESQPQPQVQVPTAPVQQPQPEVAVQEVPPEQPALQDQPTPQTIQAEEDMVVWEASEHINYNNGGGWVLLMLIGGIGLSIGIYFLVDLLSAIVVLLLLGGILFYSKLKPQIVRYTVSNQGISIGNRNYSYSEFRSFSFNLDDGISSIFLVPMQRFMVPITMYVAPDNQNAVAEVLSQHLPNEQRQPDFMDRLTAKLRL